VEIRYLIERRTRLENLCGPCPEESLDFGPASLILSSLFVYAVRDLASIPTHPLGEFLDVFVRREDAEALAKRGGPNPTCEQDLDSRRRRLTRRGLPRRRCKIRSCPSRLSERSLELRRTEQEHTELIRGQN
jgi:hypothetical protein